MQDGIRHHLPFVLVHSWIFFIILLDQPKKVYVSLEVSMLLLLPSQFINSVPEHGVLVHLPQRVGNLHGLTNSRTPSVQGVSLVASSRSYSLLSCCHDPGVSQAAELSSCFQRYVSSYCHSSDLRMKASSRDPAIVVNEQILYTLCFQRATFDEHQVPSTFKTASSIHYGLMLICTVDFA